MGHSKASAPRIRHCKHATAVMKLRLKGMRYSEIAREMGFSEQRAWQICIAELDRLNRVRAETATQLQQLELARLDEMFAALWDKAKTGDVAAIDRCLNIMARKARMLGLDAAAKVQTPGSVAVVLNINEQIVSRVDGPDSATMITDTNGVNDQAASGAGCVPEE